MASWARYAEGVDEQGEPIEVVDRLADELTADRRSRQREDPLAFVANRELFGDLVDEPRLHRALPGDAGVPARARRPAPPWSH